MNSFSHRKAGAFGCLLCFLGGLAYGWADKDCAEWAKGQFEMPSVIENAKSVSEVKAFLYAEAPFTRMAAARRTSQLPGDSRVELLLEVFDDEPYRGTPEGAPIVKLEIIRSLGRIAGKKAELALLRILTEYWNRGPRVREGKPASLDGDFASIVPLILRVLCPWADERGVFELSQQMAFTELQDPRFSTFEIRRDGWRLYLKAKIFREHRENKITAVSELLKMRRELARNGVASSSLEHAKMEASHSLLEEYDSQILSSIADKLKAELSEARKMKDLREVALLSANIYDIHTILASRKK